MKAWALVIGALFVGGASACAGTPSNAYDTVDAGQKPDVTTHKTGILTTPDGGGVCNALTCARLGYTCGVTGDGCGNMLDCGTCTAGQSCGGGGKFSVCGGTGPCVSKTCADLGDDCGPQGDGCGNLIQCGGCTAPDICGGGGKPSNCGHNGAPHPDGGLDGGPCVPLTCASQNVACGPVGDGCGNMLDCGSCTTAGQTCGGGGTNGQCGSPASCSPAASCGAVTLNIGGQTITPTCGTVADGCGGTLSCGGCGGSNICGGGGVPYTCGDVPSCTGLCQTQGTTATMCGGTNTTTLSGTVVAGTLPMYVPAGQSPDPIPNVLVYVPNGTPAAFTKGVVCQACGADVTGDPLIEATTDSNGNFTLTNVPVPASGVIPLVIQLGRWRRIFGLGNPLNDGLNVIACQANPFGQIRMPRTQAEGDIPFTAISTGSYDPMECVLLKMGVDVSEFTNPGVGGRIEMYQGNGAIVDSNTPAEPNLVPDQNGAGGTATLDEYDQVLFPCWGDDPLSAGTMNDKTQNQLNNVVSYTNGGGRMFATHLSYSWLQNIPQTGATTPFNATATWTGDPPGGSPDLEYNTGEATIDNASSSDVQTFYDWMNALAWNGATNGQFNIAQERNNFSAPSEGDPTPGTTLWISNTNAAPSIQESGSTNYPSAFPLVYAFDTPYLVDAGAQCGKVIYSDFHVSVIAGDTTNDAGDDAGGPSNDEGFTFPDECTTVPMLPQEKALEYLIWDLSSCAPGPPGPTCTPLTCADQNISCGPAGDGCGNELQCSTVDSGTGCPGCQTCGGGGTPGACGGTCCVAETCVSQNIECGPAGDGCGDMLDCGPCTNGLSCGGGGINGKCGSLEAGATCQPLTCKDQGFTCGPAGDGCGNEIQCGSCPTGAQCGAGGAPGICAPVCQPTTCEKLGFNCGPTGDGCGNELQCGACTPPATCGGGGKASICGGTSAK